MSSATIGWLIFAAYWFIAIGAWRYIFSEFYLGEVQRRQRMYRADSVETSRKEALRAPDVWCMSALFGLFWPVIAVVAIVWWPVKLVSGWIAWWFLRPAKIKTDKEYA